MSEQQTVGIESSESNGDEPSEEESYAVRFYRPDDRAGFLSLYESVFGGGSEAWLDWKYVENPYADHVPIIVAEREGDIVGAKPAFVLDMRVGDRTLLALQPCDTMVHSDHRRRGLYSRMLTHQKEAYRSREGAFFFNFPNPASMPGSLKAGWRPAARVPTYYRIQSPAAVERQRNGERARRRDAGVRQLARLSTPFVRAYLRVRDRFRTNPEGVSVDRRDEIPTTTFASLYETRVPEYVHAVRDEQFYGWRFTNPHWEYTAYTARRGGEPIAGIVAGTGTHGAVTVTNLVDIVPMVLEERERAAITALLDRIVRDHTEADVLAIRGETIPRPVLARHGFHSDQSVPLSHVASPSTLVTRPTTPDGPERADWTIAGVDLLDASNWSLSFSELDTT